MKHLVRHLVIALVVCSSAGATARGVQRKILHGLVPRELHDQSLREAHDGVIHAAHEEEKKAACEHRLNELRRLVAARELQSAVDLSYALPVDARQKLPETCSLDRPHAGLAEMTTIVATPDVRNNQGAVSQRTTHVKPRGSSKFLRVIDSVDRLLGSNRALPISGFEIDGHFVLAESPVRCSYTQNRSLACDGAGRTGVLVGDVEMALSYVDDISARHGPERHARRLRSRSVVVWADAPDAIFPGVDSGDEHSTYAVGSKSVLIIPVCASDYPNCEGRFDYNLITSAHGGNLTSYLEKVVETGNNFFERSSYGGTNITADITRPLSIDYTQRRCRRIGDSIIALARWNGKEADAIDSMSHAAALDAGYNYLDYDFTVVVLDKCDGMRVSGLGYISYPGVLLNLKATDYDPSFVHELGHNFGANHAGIMSEGSRGANAYWDAYYSGSWDEYGDPHSVMGTGDIEDGDGYGEFLISSKMIFDWVVDEKVQQVEAYDFAGTNLCNPCGPYKLEAVDKGRLSASTSTYAGIEIDCEASFTYFYLEYRTISPDTPGVIAYWTALNAWYGFSGYVHYTVLADATPNTPEWTDATIVPGSSFTIYLDKDNSDGTLEYPVAIKVDAVEGEDAVMINLYSSTTTPPTPSVVTAVPTPVPTEPRPTCKAIVDGNPSNEGSNCFNLGAPYDDVDEEDVLYVNTSRAIAGVRCCSLSGNGGSPNSFCSSACEAVDYFTALETCTKQEMRLCNETEVLNGITAGTGCTYDKMHVWTSTDCPTTGAPTATAAPTLVPVTPPTLAPTTAPTLKTCKAIVDGDKDNEANSCTATQVYDDVADPDVVYAYVDEVVAGIRCCSDNPSIAPNSFCGSSCDVYDYATALETCSQEGMRLCTEEEILQKVTSGTGCSYDKLHVWTSTNCPTTPMPTPMPAPPPTLAPAPAPTLKMCKAIVDGNKDNEANSCTATQVYDDVSDPDVLYAYVDEVVAGIRCCSDDPSIAPNSFCGAGCDVYDYASALETCTEAGMRLCTEEEILSKVTIGTGCSYDKLHVWTSTDCTTTPIPTTVPSLAPTASPAPTNKSMPTLAPTTPRVHETALKVCKAIVDGDKDNEANACTATQVYDDVADPDVMYAYADEVVAGIRCCSDDPTITPNSFCGKSCDVYDYASALETCTQAGMRLCTEEEVLDKVTSGTGCSYDKLHVWTSTDCLTTPVPTTVPSRMPTNARANATTSEQDLVSFHSPTSPPVSEPMLKVCKSIVDGDKDNEANSCSATQVYDDVADPDVMYAYADEIVAGIRCCSDNPSIAPSSFCSESCDVYDYATALETCNQEGMRLCTEEEILQKVTSGTGCSYDKLHVWTSTDCPEEGVQTSADVDHDQGAAMAPAISSCKAVVDGNVNKGLVGVCTDGPFTDSDARIKFVDTSEEVAGVGCCTIHDHVVGTSDECDHNCELVNFATAVAKCDAKGMRLCSASEVLAGQTVDSGCFYDYANVWTSDDCTEETRRL